LLTIQILINLDHQICLIAVIRIFIRKRLDGGPITSADLSHEVASFATYFSNYSSSVQ